ncbi:hypothetical protein Plano_2854 [Planococcus sp. PAMC 21323]|uniref:sigma-54-dependent Fis family transcriptional regulator n=1 Tax=Planococcus sp. PAMC 21323 TaxID=1526927 RepID=UPI000570018E|nr:sigma-54-dependent Fis family transcriptional regulator [Planococcus sp. PAMC 21323]AIY06819.1 hypothetical protein Plano_2854 [Planococcus sp. PAMC 21323]
MKHILKDVYLKDVADFLLEGIVLTDENGVILSLNHIVSDFFPKLSDSDLIGKRIQDFVPSKDLSQFYLLKQETRNISLSIGMFQLLANFRFIDDSTAFLNFRNITKIQRLSQEIVEAQNQNRLFQSILDKVDEGVCYIDNNQKIVFYNTKMGELDSKEPSGVIGKRYASIFEGATHQVSPLLNSLVSDKQIVQNEAFFSKTGKRYIVNKKSEPLFLGSQKTGALSTVKDFSTIASMADTLFQNKRTKAISSTEVAISRENLPPIIQVSKSMKKVIDTTELLTKSTANLLICGEKGVGKSLLARFTIERLNILDANFIELNCADIPSLLLEENLFGISKSPGLLEQMKNGIIVLDHIDQLDIAIQEKLLRVIQSKTFFSSKDNSEISVNTRFIALLSQKPNIALKQGNLLEDLFYALSTITLTVPSLRDRKEDIPLLINYFLQNKNNSTRGLNTAISEDALKALTSYSYSGNVRQLGYIIEGAMTLAKDDGIITLDHLPSYMVDFSHSDNESVALFNEQDSSHSLTNQVENFEKQLILNVLKKTNYHITKTADNLGISRQSLNYKIRKYDIEFTREDR